MLVIRIIMVDDNSYNDDISYNDELDAIDDLTPCSMPSDPLGTLSDLTLLWAQDSAANSDVMTLGTSTGAVTDNMRSHGTSSGSIDNIVMSCKVIDDFWTLLWWRADGGKGAVIIAPEIGAADEAVWRAAV